ncbi:MAG: glycine cleavage system aminomethyltransferase GcvT, partial [Thermoguttaceae bacterium]
MSLKRTPLYQEHLNAGGKIVDFGGWELPVQYESGILKEHENVRVKAGLFDVSHMGEICINGDGAADFIQYLTTNDISTLQPKQVQYSPICYENGGCVDDLIVYKFADNDFLLVVNASNTDKDFEWFLKQAETWKQQGKKTFSLKNCSDQYAQLALQGPIAEQVLQKLTDFPLSEIKFFRFEPSVQIAGCECLVSRTGYTGEDGFEIYSTPENAVSLWQAILNAGAGEVLPIGLGARDTLRFEAKLPLYGHEIDSDISPLEAGLGFFVKLNQPEDFIGKKSLLEQKQNGVPRTLVEFEMIGRGI